jgi:hypothetical protein
LDISQISRRAVLTAHGKITSEEIADVVKKMAEAKVHHFGKLIDVTLADYALTKDQIESIGALLRGQAGEKSRGPLAFVTDPKREDFAKSFADMTKSDRPVMLFHSIHEARKWLDAHPIT